MAKPGKTKQVSTRWIHNFNPPEQSSWAVPVSWVLAQALKHLLAGDENMVFSSDNGKLYIQAYPEQDAVKPDGADKKLMRAAATGKKLWANEWPPWP